MSKVVYFSFLIIRKYLLLPLDDVAQRWEIDRTGKKPINQLKANNAAVEQTTSIPWDVYNAWREVRKSGRKLHIRSVRDALLKSVVFYHISRSVRNVTDTIAHVTLKYLV